MQAATSEVNSSIRGERGGEEGERGIRRVEERGVVVASMGVRNGGIAVNRATLPTGVEGGMVFPQSEHSVDDTLRYIRSQLASLRLASRSIRDSPRLALFYSDSRTAPSPILFYLPPSLSLLLPRLSAGGFAYRRGPPARSRQFTISKHKQKYEWLQVGWDAVATGLAGSKWWGRDFWDAKRLAWQSLSVSLRSGILFSTPGPTETGEGACMFWR